jgi:hypothetical protein
MTSIEPTVLISPDWRDRLRIAVSRSGRKHAEIARTAGIAPSTMSRILNAHIEKPPFQTVVALMHAAGGRIGWMLQEPGYILSAQQQEQFAALLATLETERLALPEGARCG